MSRRRKRFANAWDGYKKAVEDSDHAQSELVRWAAKLGDARGRIDYYRKRLNAASRAMPKAQVVVSRGAAECVEKIKNGARELLKRVDLEAEQEGGR